jgi:uncharacterized paraquat-inducible protein A
MACKHCRSEHASGATHCQFCGEELYRLKRNEQRVYYLLIAIIIAALLIFFFSMTSLPIF